MPDSFTHGTSEQRQRWFYKGFKSGSLSGGDTFNTDNYKVFFIFMTRSASSNYACHGLTGG